MNTLFALFLAYILAPKIDLVSSSGSGVRPEDLLSVVAFALYLAKRGKAPLKLPRHAQIYAMFVGFGLLSALVNYPQEGLIGFVFAVRLLEYAVWFPIVYEACRTVPPRTVRLSLLLVSCALLVWGGLEFAGVLSKVGKFSGTSSRLTINTSGPFETSVMLAMLAYAAQQAVVTPAMLVAVVLTQSRITLVAIAGSYLAIRPGRGILLGTIAVFSAALLAGPVESALGHSRLSQSDTPLTMAQLLATEWQRVPQLDEPGYFRERFMGGDTVIRYVGNTRGDLSFKFRAIRWPLVVKSTLFSPAHVLIGWAPGAWGAALDGYYVRVFGEVGLIGTGLFLWWIVAFLRDVRRTGICHYSMWMLVIVASFIDIFTSSKVMPILWGFAALDHAGHPSAMPSSMFRRARQRLLAAPRARAKPPAPRPRLPALVQR